VRERSHKLALSVVMALPGPLMGKTFPKPQAKFDNPLVKLPSFLNPSRRWYGKKPPVNGAQECARRRRQMAQGRI